MTDDKEQLPRLQLDQLLDELQVRIEAVRGTRDRVQSLLEAVLSIGRGLELRHVLKRIVEAAVVLVDAEYGALGVIGESELLADFLPVGMSPAQVELIGHLPEGHGILGELIRHPEPLRLEEISGHPASYGFPSGHPPMHSFLGVPIRVYDRVFGNIYLTEKRGAKEFDGEDEAVLTTLAAAAGVAIENARLYEETRRRQRWLQAASEVTNALLSGADERGVLELIVETGRAILGADLGSITRAGGERAPLHVALALGLGAELQAGRPVPLEGSLAGAAFVSGEPVITRAVDADERLTASTLRGTGLESAVAVPMGTGSGVRGVLLLARAAGKAAFTPDDVAPMQVFAGQAALAMELAERRSDAEQIRIYEERDRIARDLHDLAIQRLFATGMTLQSATRFVRGPEGEERLNRAVDDLDETIKIIRTTIFGLRAHEAGPGVSGLRRRVFDTVEEAVPSLGFTPSLRTEGLVDTDVPAETSEHLVAVLREALSNVARHARASSATVALQVGHGELTLSVTDNGVGMPERGRLSGLKNLAERAARLGGESVLQTPPNGGTRLLWRVPLRY